MQRIWRRRLRWAGAIAALTLLVGVVVIWFTFQHIPDWYRPVNVPQRDNQPLKDDWQRTGENFTRMLLQSPGIFELRLTQDQINGWLAIREEVWLLLFALDRTGNAERFYDSLPTTLSDPMVVITPDALRLAATYHSAPPPHGGAPGETSHASGGLRVVVSADFGLSAQSDGLNVRLSGVGAGSLPVPVDWIRDELAARAKRWPAGKRISQICDTPLPPITALPEGALFPNTWLWDNGKIPFRIVSVNLQPGALVLGIEPLPCETRRLAAQHPDGPFSNR